MAVHRSKRRRFQSNQSRAKSNERNKKNIDIRQRNQLIQLAVDALQRALDTKSERGIREGIRTAEKAGFKGTRKEDGQNITFVTTMMLQVLININININIKINENRPIQTYIRY